MEAKICGVKDELTLRYILNHSNSPRFIGFIINYKKSKRFIELKKLNKLLSIEIKEILNMLLFLLSHLKIFLKKLKI